MNKIITTVLSAHVILACWASSVFAVEQETSQAPVDFRACKFRDGKGMKDLEKVNVLRPNTTLARGSTLAGWEPGPTASHLVSVWRGGKHRATRSRANSTR
jgi:hypothetical protein